MAANRNAPDLPRRARRVRVLAGLLALLGVALGALGGLQLTRQHLASVRREAEPKPLIFELRDPAGKRVASGGSLRIVAPEACATDPLPADAAGRVTVASCSGVEDIDYVAQAPALARAAGRVHLRTASRLVVVSLRWGSILKGQIEDDRGQPVAAAKITVESAGDAAANDTWSTVSDDTGRFSIDTLPAGVVAVQAEAELHETTVLPQVTVPTGEPQRIVLPRTSAIAGSVLGGDGKAAANAEITLAGSGVWPPRKLKADASGAFRFAPVAEGIYELRASLGSDVSEPIEGLSVDPGSVAPALLHLHPGSVLRGHVLDAQTGRSLVGVHVQISEDALSATPVSADTDAAGGYVLTGLRTRPHRLTARLPGYVATKRSVRPGELTQLELSLLRAGALVGTVLDQDGHPVPDAELEVRGTSEVGGEVRLSASLELPLAPNAANATTFAPAAGDNLGVTAGRVPLVPLAGPVPASAADPSNRSFRSDAQGQFKLDGLPPGTLRVIARKLGFAPAESAPRTLHGGEQLEGLRISLSRGGSVLGRVLQPDDSPIAHLRVELVVAAEGVPRSTVTDDQGEFRFLAVSGECSVTAYAPGLPPVRGSANVRGSEQVELTLRLDAETKSLEGRVLDARARPIENATVSLRALSARTPFAVTVLSGEDGRFEIPGLPAPPYRISADHTDYAPSKAINVATLAPITIALASGASLHGAVIDGQSNDPVAGAKISLREAASGALLSARTNSDGSFEFQHISSGNYLVTVDAAGLISESRDVPLGAPDPEREEVFVLTPGGSVSGDVVDRLGSPVWNAQVCAGDPVDWSHASRTDHAGHFVLTGLAPGEVKLNAQHPSAGRSEGAAATHVYPRQETPGVVLRLPDIAGSDAVAAEDAAHRAPAAGSKDEATGVVPRPRVASLVLEARGADAVVSEAPPGSVLHAGDVLISVDGEAVRSAAQARGMLRGARAALPIEVQRHGQRLRLRYTPP